MNGRPSAEQFAEANRAALSALPPPQIAIDYYAPPGGDLYLFDEFQSARIKGARRPPVDSLHDVFCNIADDEAEHVATMAQCQARRRRVLHQNDVARAYGAGVFTTAQSQPPPLCPAGPRSARHEPQHRGQWQAVVLFFTRRPSGWWCPVPRGRPVKREERHLLPTQAAIALAIASGALATTLGGSQLKQVLDGWNVTEITVSPLSLSVFVLRMVRSPDIVLDVHAGKRRRVLDQIMAVSAGDVCVCSGDGPTIELFNEQRRRAGALVFLDADVFLLLPYVQESILLSGAGRRWLQSPAVAAIGVRAVFGDR